MLIIDKNFVESMPIALFLTDNHGIIYKMNDAARSILKCMDLDAITSIKEIDPKLVPETFNSMAFCQWSNHDNTLTVGLNLYRVKYEDGAFYHLYVLDDSKQKINEFNTLLDGIDDLVAIFDKNLVLEHINDAFMNHTGIDGKKLIGKSIYEMKNENIVENPLAPKVFESKKVVSERVKYKSGSVLTLTGVPLFSREGEVNKIVLTGRDISELIFLEETLKNVEKEKNIYYTKVKELEGYLGASEAIYSSDIMKHVLNIVFKASKTDSSIFIWGESGVGKEVIARLIHNSSKRRDKPFVAINCAAIPSELLESELFGYDEGAFTGAKKQGKKGLFEEADGGTIFLDEIGEIPRKMQSKLLRVIQENGLTRVGGRDFIPIDVRYISATNLIKDQLTDNNSFRQDLYYRLGVIPIKIPPLRERKEDIVPLIYHFIEQFNEKYHSNVRISKEAMKLMYSHDWPGNVRELKNTVERLIVLAETELVSAEDYIAVSKFDAHNNAIGKDEEILNHELIPLKEAYAILEQSMIKRALKEESNVVKAAKILGIAPSTIYRKLKKGEIVLGQ